MSNSPDKPCIDEALKKISNQSYGYYCTSPAQRVREKLFPLWKEGFNCTDSDYAEELCNKLKGEYVRGNIVRKPTVEELEWIEQQETVTDPEVLEELRPALEWMNKYVFTKDNEEK